MKTKAFNKEVLFTNEPIVRVKEEDIRYLKEQSNLNERKRIRLCVHRDIQDRIHEMLIIHRKNTYIRPHKHLQKIESFHIIEGEAQVIIYNDEGLISDIISMGEYGKRQNFFYRLSEPLFHTLWITSDYLVFHETTNGPFKKSDIVWAGWAPDENNHVAVHKFMQQLRTSIEAFLSLQKKS